MAIVSSQIIEDVPQIDGRRHVTERHVDHVGLVHFWRYLAEQLADVSAAMSARVAAVESRLKRREIERVISLILDDDYTGIPATHWNTNAEVGLAIRAYYQQSTDGEAIRIGWYINSLGLNDNQLKAFFGLNDGNLAAAKVKLTTYAAMYESLLAAEGE